jgi:hypothetical protein
MPEHDKKLADMTDAELVERVLGSKYQGYMDPTLLEITTRLAARIQAAESADDNKLKGVLRGIIKG